MHIFRREPFEIGVNLDLADEEVIQEMFRVMRECPECGAHPDEIDELEDEVWAQYFLRDIE